MFLLGLKNVVLGYERVLNSSQSFSINLGYLELPDFEDEDGKTIEFFGLSDKGGYVIAADYRFYLQDRNKYPIPDGLYWGPYGSVINLYYQGKTVI